MLREASEVMARLLVGSKCCRDQVWVPGALQAGPMPLVVRRTTSDVRLMSVCFMWGGGESVAYGAAQQPLSTTRSSSAETSHHLRH